LPDGERKGQPIGGLFQSDLTAELDHFAPPLTWNTSAMAQS
jgi:hypothetical protein